MNKLKKIAIITVIVQLAVVGLLNYLCYQKYIVNENRLYKVEGKRIAEELERTPANKIDIKKYNHIILVSEFKPPEIVNNDYMVYKVGNKLYKIEYNSQGSNGFFLYMNVVLIGFVLISIFIFIYIGRHLVNPFQNMENMSLELAKGNLTTPLKADKNRYFGKFIWGLDMLRETLEGNREKELELQKDKKTLILSISHDIKTPLSAIDLYVKALQSGLYDTEEKKAQALIGIQENSNRIKEYVNEINKASREDFLNLEVHEGEFYLREAMDTISDYYAEKLAIIHTDFLIEKMENCLLIGDIDRFVEVIQNIIENAIKYGDGNYIRISYNNEEDCKLIQIENSGSKIKQEELSHIFDSFYRGSNSEKVRGSGLGLYICKELMTKMGGDIFVKLNEDKFSMYVVIRKA